MVRLSKIYTKTGDSGKTQLGDGSTVNKSSLRVIAYGEVDESNACLGVAIAQLSGSDRAEHHALQGKLQLIQNELFDLGADLCVPLGDEHKSRLRVTQNYVDRLEAMIDEFNAALKPLNSFVLPGGAMTAAQLHVTRTVVRRAERAVAQLMEQEPSAVNPLCLIYLNRLSDLMFVLARVANDNGEGDVLWKPGNRSGDSPAEG